MLRTTLTNDAISRTRRWPTWARYARATGIVVAAFLLRRAADPILPQGYPYLLAFVGVLLSAALFDHASGLLAITLSAALADWFYLPPIGRLAAQAQGDVVGLALFGAVSAAISFTVETLHRALADLQRASATGRLPSTTSPARTPIRGGWRSDADCCCTNSATGPAMTCTL